jgi:DNA polymerase III epsilon subunit-like protein
MSDIRHYRLALIFDVETNGLIPRNDPVTKLPPPITECPHIIQMSFIIYNMYEHNIEKTYNVYINIPNEVEISNKITELTGITREMCNDGISIVEALSEFHEAYSACDCVIAHNLDFDSKMMLIEIERNSQLLLEKNPKICDIFQTKVNIKCCGKPMKRISMLKFYYHRLKCYSCSKWWIIQSSRYFSDFDCYRHGSFTNSLPFRYLWSQKNI